MTVEDGAICDGLSVCESVGGCECGCECVCVCVCVCDFE